MKIAENIVNVLERTLESMHAVNTIQVHMEIDKPARLIIRLLFGFASDLTNSNNLQILRRYAVYRSVEINQDLTRSL